MCELIANYYQKNDNSNNTMFKKNAQNYNCNNSFFQYSRNP